MKEQKKNKEKDEPTLTVDYEKYRAFLDESDLTEDEKQQVVQALWEIICNFVDLGVGVHPVQQTGREAEPIQAVFELATNTKPDQHEKGVDA